MLLCLQLRHCALCESIRLTRLLCLRAERAIALWLRMASLVFQVFVVLESVSKMYCGQVHHETNQLNLICPRLLYLAKVLQQSAHSCIRARCSVWPDICLRSLARLQLACFHPTMPIVYPVERRVHCWLFFCAAKIPTVLVICMISRTIQIV